MTSESLLKRVDNSSIIFYRSPLRLPPAIQAFMYMYYILLGVQLRKIQQQLCCAPTDARCGLDSSSNRYILPSSYDIKVVHYTFIPFESQQQCNILLFIILKDMTIQTASRYVQRLTYGLLLNQNSLARGKTVESYFFVSLSTCLLARETVFFYI